MNYWCESCARKNLCYVVDDRPKCFVPITNTASGTPESYLAKSLRDSRDSHEIAKTEPQKDCNTCKNKGFEGCEQPCFGCGWCDLYEPKTEPIIYGNEHNCIMTLFGDCSYNETGCGSCAVVEKVRDALGKDEPTGYNLKPVEDEPQIETKTETKNSNLTFEKRTMRDCYNCKRYETEGECIECHYEPKDEPQIFTWGKEVHEFCKMKCNKSKARSFDGDRFIVCGQSNDAICINLPACPLGKWITGKGYHILPMDESQTEREGE